MSYKGQQSSLHHWTITYNLQQLYYTFRTKHDSSAINDKLRTAVVDVTTSTNQEVDIIPYDSEPHRR